MNIVTNEGRVAFTLDNCPGTGRDGASPDQLRRRAELMNQRAEQMGLNVRYQVSTASGEEAK